MPLSGHRQLEKVYPGAPTKNHTVLTGLSTKVMERYLKMLSRYPNLFITSYEEIRGFKGEDLRIHLKEGARPVK